MSFHKKETEKNWVSGQTWDKREGEEEKEGEMVRRAKNGSQTEKGELRGSTGEQPSQETSQETWEEEGKTVKKEEGRSKSRSSVRYLRNYFSLFFI